MTSAFGYTPAEPCRHHCRIHLRRITAGEIVASVQVLQVDFGKCPGRRWLPKGARPLLADTRQHHQPVEQRICFVHISSAVAMNMIGSIH